MGREQVKKDGTIVPASISSKNKNRTGGNENSNNRNKNEKPKGGEEHSIKPKGGTSRTRR